MTLFFVVVVVVVVVIVVVVVVVVVVLGVVRLNPGRTASATLTGSGASAAAEVEAVAESAAGKPKGVWVVRIPRVDVDNTKLKTLNRVLWSHKSPGRLMLGGGGEKGSGAVGRAKV